MSKAEEIQLLRTFQGSLPAGSYLATLFECIVPQFETDTRRDFPCLPSVREIEVDIQRLELRRGTLSKDVAGLSEKHSNLSHQCAVLGSQMDSIRQQARRLANF
jgi:hypothetical protein